MDLFHQKMHLMIWISREKSRTWWKCKKIGWTDTDIGGTALVFRLTDGSDYTINIDGDGSWRVEVALRAILLAAEEEKLQKFLEGYYDGAPEQAKVNDILRGILEVKVGQCEKVLAGKWTSCIEKDMVRTLWEGELNIARKALEVIMK